MAGKPRKLSEKSPEMRDPFWRGYAWAPPRPTPRCAPGHVLHKSHDWRVRNGARVPRAECLPPMERVSVRAFVAMIEAMMGGGGGEVEA